jgi:hypothetical protein
MAQQFFYDSQIRRFLTQFIRVVSGFQVEFGQGATGQRALQQVPVLYGDPSRQAAQIIKQNSENLLSSVPAMSVYISALDYNRDAMADPTFISKINVRQREYDPTTGDYLHGPGDSYTVERLMPVPYKLTLKLDIWTSNTEQKLQLIEQLAQLFNPSLELQSTDNYIDWGSLTVVELKSTVWDSRSIPSGADESISVATLQFEMPIWISSPAKVKRLGVVTNMINNVFDSNGNISEDVFTSADLMTRRVVSLRDYHLLYIGNTLKLIKNTELGANPSLANAEFDSWVQLMGKTGKVRNGVSQVRLRHPNGISEVVGTIANHPTDETSMLYTPNVDTLPGNTLSPVTAIIDPATVDVEDYSLMTPVSGTRYLILNPIGRYTNTEAAEAWDRTNPLFVANAGDIIEYRNGQWTVSFDSENSTDYQYVTNLTTTVQYKYDFNVREWAKSVEGVYSFNNWSIVI